ncbi:hypothetical protein BD413DRAFT_511860 [Trametes elegans]|nr:hypothetical protein BD413DRAFT_511860 [Trametes elegans]
MRRSSESPQGSARKRRRLSSPTYEEHYGPISQEDVQAFEQYELELSQSAPAVPSQLRALPSEGAAEAAMSDDPLGEIGLGVVEGENHTEWSSSPPSHVVDCVTDDNFFTTGPSSGGFISAASVSANAATTGSNGLLGFASAASLPSEPIPSQSFGGFAFAAKLSNVPQSQTHTDGAREAIAPFVAPKFVGPTQGHAPAAQTGNHHSPSPSPPPPQQDYDSWFDADASVLPPDAFAFKTARTIMSSSQKAADPQGSQLAGFTSGLAKLQSASQADGQQDYSVPAADISGFASAAHLGFAPAGQVGLDPPGAVGFSSARGSKGNWAAPSAEALARAAKRMQQWESELDKEETLSSVQDVENNAPANSRPPASHDPSLQTPLRPALRPVENASAARPPGTQSPAGGASKGPPHYTVVAGMQIKNTPFKSPLMSRPQQGTRSISMPSPLNPARPLDHRVASGTKLPPAFGSANAIGGSSTPTKAPPGASAFVSPVKPGSAAFTSPLKANTSGSVPPVKALGMTPRRLGISGAVGKAKFSTPFKKGMAPGDPGRTQLERKLKEEQVRAAASQTFHVQTGGSPSKRVKEKKVYQFFDLNPPADRTSLASSGIRPMSYTEDELEDLGISVEELRQMRPSNAVFYRFSSDNATNTVDDPELCEHLGPKAAFVNLRERGCHLASQAWVTNHYGLVLWKLAGMVCMQPELEQNPKTRRWCWPEVIRQLLYRYERELNGGSRPALRLISTEDAPAACPMILCVSNIVVRGSSMVDRYGVPLEPHPELEVTDGWYRLRATVDPPLARAIRRGRICIGSKLAVSGAKLSGDRKEACEILDAYENTFLELQGNSTNLAPWHAKLGFVKQPFIATLDKLTPDGGVVPAMDLIITKTYPIAFLEFIKNEDGTLDRVGPRDEKEEMKAQDQWLAKREAESVKIRENLEAHIAFLRRCSERLHSLAGPRFDYYPDLGDDMPDHIEDKFNEMMDASSPSQTWDFVDFLTNGWLHRYCLQQADLAAARMPDDIARELEQTCPPRNVRDFRVVVAKDARWSKKEPMRTVQVTLWDPLKTIFSESGNPGEIKEGQRFLVTNLAPNQANAWMTPGPDAEVYLVAKRTSRWTNIKSAKC